jgi:hypothetical protein
VGDSKLVMLKLNKILSRKKANNGSRRKVIVAAQRGSE